MPRILVVEDSAANRLLARELLTAHGYDVFEAESGSAALELARSVEPELILLDLQLPDIDGFDVLRRLREECALTSVPVLALTAFSHEPVRERAVDAGFDGFVTKPIRYRVLLEAMHQAFERRGSR